MMEAAYVGDSVTGPKIIVGWQGNKAIIRSAIGSGTDPLYEYNEADHGNSWVGEGKLYGVDGGELQNGDTVYVAVGSNGSIYRSVNGYQFSPVAQEFDPAAQLKHLVANDDYNSATGHLAAVTTDNRLYYSTDGGTTWTYAHKVMLSGEVAALKFINQNYKQRLFIGTNEGSAANIYQLTWDDNSVVKQQKNAFTIRGMTQTTTSGPDGAVFYGQNPTNSIAKMVSQNQNGNGEFIESRDKLLDNSADLPSGAIQLMIDYNNQQKFSFIADKVYLTTLEYNITGNGSSYNGEINKAYVGWAQGNERQVLMDASGYVRVVSNVMVDSARYTDTLISTGQAIPASANFDLRKLVFVNGMFAAQGKDGNVYTSFDGIVWTPQASLSSMDYVDLAGSNNMLLLLDKNNAIHKVTMSYNPWDSNTVVKDPNVTVTKPLQFDSMSAISVDTSNDPHADGNTVTYQWLVRYGSITEPQPLTGQTSSTLSLSALSNLNEVMYIYVDVTYSNPSKVDQSESTRRFGSYSYAIPFAAEYTATSFTAVEGYIASDIPKITVTATSRIVGTPVTDLQISSSDSSVVVGTLSRTTLTNYGDTATAQLSVAPNLTKGTYTANITVSSATGNLSKTQTITVNVDEAPRYELTANVDRDSIQLAHDYASTNPDDAKVTLTMENTGNRDIDNVTVTLSDTQKFELSSNVTQIAESATETIEITPKAALQAGQSYSYTVSIASSVTQTITKTVVINVAEAPRYDVTLAEVKNNVTVSPGYTAAEGELVVLITNTGNRDLNDLAVDLQGAGAGSFTYSSVSPNLAAGQSVSVTVTPNTSLIDGDYLADLVVTSAANSITKSQALKLTVSMVPVYDVQVSLDKSALNLAHNYSSSNGIIEVTLRNNGNTTVEPSVSVSDPTVFDIVSSPSSIANNASASFNLTVKENLVPGTYNVTLSVAHDGGTKTAAITVVVAPAPLYQLTVSFDKTTLNLTTGYTTGAGKFVLTATNTGNQDLDVTVFTTNATNTGIPLETAFWSNGMDGPKAPGVTATKDLVPIAGLPVGTHTLAVTIKADGQADQLFNLTIVVADEQTQNPNPQPDPGPSQPQNPTPGPSQPQNPTEEPAPETSQNPLSTSETTTNENGSIVVSQQVNEQKVAELLASAANGTTVRIAQETDADIVKTELSGNLLQSLGDKQAVLEVETNNGTYKLPTDQLDLNALAQQFGAGVAASDLQVTVNIAKSDAQTAQVVANAASSGNFTLVVPPVEFSVTVSYNGQTQEITQYSEYVTREIPIPSNVDARLITTAVVLDKDGSLRAVPTTLVQRDGKYYAVIKSLTNSIYTLIHHDVTFDDVVGHWSKEAVHNLANRLVLNGTSEQTFSPAKAITRAEFAAIIVRALGLPQDGSVAGFKDVQASDWYAGAVAKASEYGLIDGYQDDTFRPSATITRQEAFVIIARAMKLAGLEANVSSDQALAILTEFEDNATVSKWAATSLAAVVRSGIAQGANAKLRPTGNITRAETAVIVQRLLTQAGLIE